MVSKVYEAGRAAYMDGKDQVPPDYQNSEDRRTWIQGWNDAQQENFAARKEWGKGASAFLRTYDDPASPPHVYICNPGEAHPPTAFGRTTVPLYTLDAARKIIEQEAQPSPAYVEGQQAYSAGRGRTSPYFLAHGAARDWYRGWDDALRDEKAIRAAGGQPDADPNDRLEQEIRERVAREIGANKASVGVVLGAGLVLVKVARPDDEHYTGYVNAVGVVMENMGISLYHVL